MRAQKPALPWFLAALTSAGALVGCATAKPAPTAVKSQAAAPSGPVIPFAFAPPLDHPWGLRVARHRTLPPPPGTDGQALHFDSEEDSRITVTRPGHGDFVLTETLARHAETKNGDPNPDAVMVALTGIPVRTQVSPEGLFRGAVGAAQTVRQIAQNWPGGGNAAFANLPPEVFTQELERDWRLGAEVYFTRPIHVGEPVYSLLSVSLPQLPGKYVAVAERFAAPVSRGDGTRQVTSTQEIFGKRDARWPAAHAALESLMKSLGVSDDDVLDRFQGQGGETVGVRSLQVYSASYEGEGVFPLTTARGSFPLRFRVEEIAGAIDPPAIPINPNTTAAAAAARSKLARR